MQKPRIIDFCDRVLHRTLCIVGPLVHLTCPLLYHIRIKNFKLTGSKFYNRIMREFEMFIKICICNDI